MPFMTKSLSRVRMKRTRLINCHLKKRSEQNWLSYVKQHNYCVSLLRKQTKNVITQTWMSKILSIINSFEDK